MQSGLDTRQREIQAASQPAAVEWVHWEAEEGGGGVEGWRTVEGA